LTLLYPGSFDPVTNGHIDVALRGAKLADKLIVAVLDNPNKKNQMFSLEERENFLRVVFRDYANVEVFSFSGLLVNFAKDCGANAILRGLRNPSDFENEYPYAAYNRLLSVTEIDTVYVAATPELSFVSSSAVREMVKYLDDLPNINALSSLIPDVVLEAILNLKHY